MKSPKVPDVIRYFKYFGVNQIFQAVSRTEASRRKMGRSLQGLVDARNGIAHGDQTVQPSRADLTEYLNYVAKFCERADNVMSKRIEAMTGGPPW